jgi:hypothetical protein
LLDLANLKNNIIMTKEEFDNRCKAIQTKIQQGLDVAQEAQQKRTALTEKIKKIKA